MSGMPAAGDLAILQNMFEYRILESGQLAALTERSTPVIRRRLRGFLHEQGLIQILHGSAADQKAYALSPKGIDQVAQHLGLDPKHLPFSRHPPSGPGSPFYRHLRLANSIAIAFHLACGKASSPVDLVEKHFEWEMVRDLRRRRSKKPWEKFTICEALPELRDPQELQILRPDLVLCFQPRTAPRPVVAVYVEADRATMSVQGALMRKLRPYWLLFLREGFKRYGQTEAAGMRVLFVFASVTTDQRLHSFWQTLERFCKEQAREHAQFNEARTRLALAQGKPLRRPLPEIDLFAECFRLARWDQLREANLLTDPVWHTHEGDKVPFFRGAPSPAPRDNGAESEAEASSLHSESSPQVGPPATPKSLRLLPNPHTYVLLRRAVQQPLGPVGCPPPKVHLRGPRV